jgi:hypothetical protein
VLLSEEAFEDSAIQEGEERVEVSRDVHEPARLLAKAKLCPREDIREFLQGAEPAGKRIKPSERSLINCLRWSIDATTRSSVRPRGETL